ncbi:hypothetical protein D3H65_07375 [Paraflavitalea soli]|uniref:Uncharacterized protein n=1 Tax=Paraflavitalea soli TaxID=2315862 RepID=A0A3B7MHX7_9BACT|nr:hypothetical protein [Paraflavitalea soli]AXY73808.1 hypothetical protein D3H65_07375 [Paraflavitalea soli]
MKYKFFCLILLVAITGCAAESADSRIAPAGTHLINISPGRDLWNTTGRKNPELLFDKSIADGNKTDQEYFMNNDFAKPMVFFISLGDSCYDKLAIDYFHGHGASNWTITVYDSNRVQKGEYKITGGSNKWDLLQGDLSSISSPIRFIRFQSADPSSDVREIRIYGNGVAKCSPIVPVVAAKSFPDPGISFQGGSSIGGKDVTYMKLQSGLPLYGSFRSPSNVFNWVHDFKAPIDQQAFEIDKYGDFDKNTLSFHKSMGTPVMLYINGANVKTVPGLKTADDYNAMTQTNVFKDIPPGSDSTAYEPWTKSHGRLWKVMAHLWGSNRNDVLPDSYKIYGASHPNLAAGQDKIKVFEIGNEDDKTWFGLTGYHSPTVLLQKLKAAWDAIKTTDPNAKVYLGALLSADTVQWKALYFLNYWLYPGQPFPADGFCFNQYISNRYGGQSHHTDADAVSPEQFQVTERITSYRNFRDRYFPGKGLRWTEIGYAVGNSDYNVKSVPGIPDTIVAANFMVRTLERAAVVPNGLEVVYNYFHTSDGSGVFGSMYMVREQFDPTTYAYSGSHRMPIWWWYATRMNVLHDYKGWSTMVKNGDSTGITVTRYDHKTNPALQVYYVCRGTYDGSVSKNYPVNVGKATKATLVTLTVGKEEGSRTELPVKGGVVVVPLVNEAPQYIITSQP